LIKVVNKPFLNNISFSVESGELMAITGEVGSGKSLLLLTLLGELPSSSGKIEISGKMFYVSQEPWIFSTTLKQNILFGKPYDPDRFDKIIEVCELREVFA
jgi:ATP-binding cassette subfamily C (CFTR/MRP) protein 4